MKLVHKGHILAIPRQSSRSHTGVRESIIKIDSAIFGKSVEGSQKFRELFVFICALLFCFVLFMFALSSVTPHRHRPAPGWCLCQRTSYTSNLPCRVGHWQSKPSKISH
jgi:hypothetical protein